ncbi:MAG: 6-bladed beta-propeller [Candidatus Delongbacteria bacterium]|nr:6-bladed beta-propeller [Candidatus Delongbacteria bacterium]
MRFKYLIMVAAAALVISCGSNSGIETVDGVKIIKNGNAPSDRNVNIKTEFLFSLNEDTGDTSAVIRTISSIEVDEKGNIYILDRRKSTVFKFSPEGSLIKTFGQSGTGPGEMARPEQVLVSNDTVYVTDMRQRKVIMFDNEGAYVRDIIPLRDNGFPRNISKVTEDKFAGVLFGRGGRGGPGNRTVNINFSLLDSRFEKIADMVSEQFEIDGNNFNPMDHDNKFTTGGGRIYYAENTEDKILVNVFDSEGKKIEEIRKSYAKVMYSDLERQKFQERAERDFRWREFDASTLRYKKSVENIFWHNDGYLLLECAKKTDENERSNFVVDIYRDGVYLNTADLNRNDPEFYSNDDGFAKILRGDKLFVYNEDDNIISVYRIKITQ